MVREVGVHDDGVVARGELEAVHVGRAETELAGARFEEDALGAVDRDELFCDVLGAVGGAVVDDDEFPVEFAGVVLGRVYATCVYGQYARIVCATRVCDLDVLLFECLCQKPGNYWQVPALIVGWQEH